MDWPITDSFRFEVVAKDSIIGQLLRTNLTIIREYNKDVVKVFSQALEH